MDSKRSHHELDKFVHDFNKLLINPEESCIDDIWEIIIKDVCEYKKRDQYKWYYGSIPAQNFSFEQSDRPDIIYQCEDFIMGIECFQFDASKKTRKGSKQKQMECKADRDIIEEYRRLKVPTGGFLSIERPVDVELSITSYYDSLASTFRAHANSINDYRKKLELLSRETRKRVLLSFYIEDTTAIGNYIITNGRTEALNPLKTPLFLEELKLTQGVDYIIIKTTDCYVPSIRIQKISIPLLNRLYKKCYGSNDKFVQYKYKRESHFWG